MDGKERADSGVLGQQGSAGEQGGWVTGTRLRLEGGEDHGQGGTTVLSGQVCVCVRRGEERAGEQDVGGQQSAMHPQARG